MTFTDYIYNLSDDHDIYSDFRIRMTLSGYGYLADVFDCGDSLTAAALTGRLFKPDAEFQEHLRLAFNACLKLIDKDNNFALKLVENMRNTCAVDVLSRINVPADHPIAILLKSRDYMHKEMRGFEMRLVKVCIAIGEANKWD